MSFALVYCFCLTGWYEMKQAMYCWWGYGRKFAKNEGEKERLAAEQGLVDAIQQQHDRECGCGAKLERI